MYAFNQDIIKEKNIEKYLRRNKNKNMNDAENEYNIWKSIYLNPNTIYKKSHKVVMLIETEEVFEGGISEAARIKGFNFQGISNACRGVRQTYRGYHWKYLD